MKSKKLKLYSVYRNGTEHTTIEAYSKVEARSKMIRAYGTEGFKIFFKKYIY